MATSPSLQPDRATLSDSWTSNGANEVTSRSQNITELYDPETITCLVNNFRKRGEYCDVILKVEDSEFPANKIVLAAFSPFFKTMFSGRFVESTQSYVSLKRVNVDDMAIILDYAYTGKIEITSNNVVVILRTAHFLQASALIELCKRFLERNITVENCLEIWYLAEVYSWPSLQKDAKSVILSEFTEICKTSDFLELESSKLASILRDDSLEVENEKIVLEAVIRWFHFKEAERIDDLGKVFKHVRLAHVDPDYLLDRFENNKVLCQSNEVRKLVEEAKLYFWLPNRRLEMQSSVTRRRNNASLIEVLHVSCKCGSQICFSEDGHIFRPAVAIPFKIPYSTTLRNYQVLAHSKDYEVFSLLHENRVSWERPFCLLQQRSNIVLGESDGFWFAIGGRYSDGTACRLVERYDPFTKEWTPVAELLIGVWNANVVSMSGNLYIIGGYRTKTTRTLRMQRYNLRDNEWTELAPLPKLDWKCQACALNNYIYTCCYCNPPFPDKCFYAYNAERDKWHRLAKMNHKFVSGPVLLNGRIFVLSENADGHCVLESYNPAFKMWVDCRLFTDIEPNYVRGPYLFNRDWEVKSKDENLVGVCVNAYADQPDEPYQSE